MYGNRRGTTFARRPLLLRLRRWPTGAVLSSLCRRRDQYLGEHRHRHYGQGLRRLMCAATGDQTVSSLHATDLSSQNNKTLQPAGQAGAPDLFRTINAVTRLGRRDAWPLPYNCATVFYPQLTHNRNERVRRTRAAPCERKCHSPSLLSLKTPAMRMNRIRNEQLLAR